MITDHISVCQRSLVPKTVGLLGLSPVVTSILKSKRTRLTLNYFLSPVFFFFFEIRKDVLPKEELVVQKRMRSSQTLPRFNLVSPVCDEICKVSGLTLALVEQSLASGSVPPAPWTGRLRELLL